MNARDIQNRADIFFIGIYIVRIDSALDAVNADRDIHQQPYQQTNCDYICEPFPDNNIPRSQAKQPHYKHDSRHCELRLDGIREAIFLRIKRFGVVPNKSTERVTKPYEQHVTAEAKCVALEKWGVNGRTFIPELDQNETDTQRSG